MSKIFRKTKDYFSLKFPDPKVEHEYSHLKTQNSLNDFKATAYYMILLSMFSIYTSVHFRDWLTFYFSIATFAFAFILLIAQFFMKRGFQYLILLLLIFFLTTRLIGTYFGYDKFNKSGMYIFAYQFAINQVLLLNLIQNFTIKIITTVGSLSLRTLVLAFVAEDLAHPSILVRQFVIDAFLIYILFSMEKQERKIFRSFFENRDELVKFKEFLADSLPQSLTIIDLQTQRRLFVNHLFQESFDVIEPCQATEVIELTSSESTQRKPNFHLLQMDLTTLREVGTLNLEWNEVLHVIGERTCSLERFLEKNLNEELIKERALSINATSSEQGKKRRYQITFKKIKWDRNDAVAIILNDTTYQENLISLKIANSNKDQIIATVSHELRTPLHGIIGLLEIAEKRVNDEEVLENLSLCKDNAHLLASLVNSLLDLQQLRVGKLKLNIAKMSLIKTLKDVTKLFKFQCENKNIDLEYEISQEISGDIITDENRFKQILINLIGNAIKFTFKGGIKIKVSQDHEDEDGLIVSVRDSGIGIKEENIEKIFVKYGKLAESRQINQNGVGLGLTISSSLAALLNGQTHERGIQVVSQYGEGSNFFFKILKNLNSTNGEESPKFKQGFAKYVKGRKIPSTNSQSEPRDSFVLIEHDEEQTIGSKVMTHQWKHKETFLFQNLIEKNSEVNEIESEIVIREEIENKTFLNCQTTTDKMSKKDFPSFPVTSNLKECILVVDDNPFNLLVAKSLLKDLGYDVKSASGGHEAIKIVQECMQKGISIKVIFLDCQMPIMDGYETARTLRNMMKNGEAPEIPMLAWTANNGEQDIKRCYESGMTGYLMKPTTKESVLKVLKSEKFLP